MSLTAKLSAIGIGGGALAVGGTYLLKNMTDVMPPWHSLAEDKDYTTKSESSGEYHQKYGATYSNYLIGVNEAAENKQPKSNDILWNWIYLNRFKETSEIKGKFKDVKRAIGDESDNLSLKAVCKEAYKDKKENGKIKTTESIGENDFLEEYIWKFCSPIGQKPTTLSDTKNSTEKGKYTSKLGSEEDKTSKFISVEDPGNEIFWAIRQEEFFKGSGKFSPPQETGEEFFKTFYDEEKSKPKEQRLTIRDKCRDAYLTPKNEQNTKPTADNIVKYCSLDGSSS